VREINHYVDITGTFGRKVAAVRAHASQIQDQAALPERLRQRIAQNATAAGLAEGRLAEALQVVVTGKGDSERKSSWLPSRSCRGRPGLRR
jgi:LmbE family N-acetylglucosaminyl deacetylase